MRQLVRAVAKNNKARGATRLAHIREISDNYVAESNRKVEKRDKVVSRKTRFNVELTHAISI